MGPLLQCLFCGTFVAMPVLWDLCCDACFVGPLLRCLFCGTSVAMPFNFSMPVLWDRCCNACFVGPFNLKLNGPQNFQWLFRRTFVLWDHLI